MQFGLNFVPLGSAADNAAWWRAADAAGIRRIGFGDTPALARELYVTLTACALSTEHATIMPSVTNPLTRHPAVAGAAILSLAELAPGRIAFGIGTGDSAAWGVGLQAASVEAVRAYVDAVRRFMAGDEVRFAGQSFTPAWLDRPEQPVPLYVACAGPRMVRMAAQVADGLIVGAGYGPDDLDLVRETIESGCRDVGRDPAGLDVWWNAPVHFADSVEAALRDGVNLTASWLLAGDPGSKRIPERFRGSLAELTRDMRDLTATYRTPNRHRILFERAQDLGLADWLIARSARLWGAPSDIVARLNELAGQGCVNWMLNLPVAGPRRMIALDALVRDVIPQVGSGGSA